MTLCNEVLFTEGEPTAICDRQSGTEHSHSDVTALQAVVLGIASPYLGEPYEVFSEGYALALRKAAERMCLGSEMLGYRPLYSHDSVLCKTCDSWVKAYGQTSALVPVHDKPYSDEDEVVYARRAAHVLMYEYRQARVEGTLHGDPNRFHVTALAMVRPRASLPAKGQA